MNILSKNIKKFRLEKGWSLAELGQKSNISESYIRQIEAGGKGKGKSPISVSLDRLRRLADAFGLLPGQLIDKDLEEDTHENSF